VGFSLSKLFRKKPREKRSTASLKAIAASDGTIAFYAGKSAGRPRFVYRRLAQALDAAASAAERQAALQSFRDELKTNGSRGEGLKLRMVLPPFLEKWLRPDERAELEPWLAALRARRGRLRDAFPDCADEFSLAPAFLDSALGVEKLAVIERQTRIFTMGSCFARNIAVFLQGNGFTAEAFMQTEDLNSPFSNARMLSVAAAPPDERQAFVARWIETLYPDESSERRAARRDEALGRLAGLADSIASAEVVIVTIGSALDFFLPAGASADQTQPGSAVAPKFLLLADTEDADKRAGLAQRLKAQGASFRLGTFAESKTAISRFYSAVRALNPHALCLFTLSPVPMDSAIGLQKTAPGGAAEIDCVSKSTLRAALHEAMAEWIATDPKVRYFPSYEIVRWIAPNLPIQTFGAEDASARHVSEQVLNGVCDYFLDRFGADRAAANRETLTSKHPVGADSAI
jgi:hypothetical protein